MSCWINILHYIRPVIFIRVLRDDIHNCLIVCYERKFENFLVPSYFIHRRCGSLYEPWNGQEVKDAIANLIHDQLFRQFPPFLNRAKRTNELNVYTVEWLHQSVQQLLSNLADTCGFNFLMQLTRRIYRTPFKLTISVAYIHTKRFDID